MPTELGARRSAALHWLLLALALAGGVLLVYAPLLLTNRVLGSGDAFTYFTPYRDFANAALRSGQLPLWNPYLFMGAPFLANPQTAIFYPLHWPFVALDAATSLEVSLALHLWLAGLGVAVYARRVAGLGWLASLVSGLVFSLSGYLGARAGQVNQVSAAAWLPWLLTLLEASVPRWRLSSDGSSQRPARALHGLAWAGLALTTALLLLAGHAQSSFIVLTGLMLAALWPGLVSLAAALLATLRRAPRPASGPGLRAAGGRAAAALGAVVAGFLLAAVQLLPTLELSALSIRSGGLSWREAVSFSLQPRGLLLTLLPSMDENLAARFATPAFGEYVAYVGVAGLLLALLAAARSAQRGWPPAGPRRRGGWPAGWRCSAFSWRWAPTIHCTTFWSRWFPASIFSARRRAGCCSTRWESACWPAMAWPVCPNRGPGRACGFGPTARPDAGRRWCCWPWQSPCWRRSAGPAGPPCSSGC
ncbi:MAG: hypothetical protein V9H69_03290 [Anaerolineae bacterium]